MSVPKWDGSLGSHQSVKDRGAGEPKEDFEIEGDAVREGILRRLRYSVLIRVNHFKAKEIDEHGYRGRKRVDSRAGRTSLRVSRMRRIKKL